MKPSQIVTKLCKQHNVDQPVYYETSVSILGRTYHADSLMETETGQFILSIAGLQAKIILYLCTDRPVCLGKTCFSQIAIN